MSWGDISDSDITSYDISDSDMSSGDISEYDIVSSPNKHKPGKKQLAPKRLFIIDNKIGI